MEPKCNDAFSSLVREYIDASDFMTKELILIIFRNAKNPRFISEMIGWARAVEKVLFELDNQQK